MRVIVVQPAMPLYRRKFFSRLCDRINYKLVVYTSYQNLGVLTENTAAGHWERPLGQVRRILPGLDWQLGAMSINILPDDIVVVSGAPRCLSNLALLIKAKIKGARTVWWGHFWSATSRPWRAQIRRVLMQMADALLFYTDLEVREYTESGEAGPKIVRALNNGIETREIRNLRVPYDAETRFRDLLFIGRLSTKAELNLLVDALASPAASNFTLDVIGGGELEAGLRARCRQLGIAERVIWHGGITDEHQIASIANVCKAFVYPGAVGLSLVHAHAYGLPAIVHNDRLRHMPEIAAFSSGLSGVTFARGDMESLVAAMREVLLRKDRLNQMSSYAIAVTDESFNSEDMISRFLGIIDLLVEKKSRGG